MGKGKDLSEAWSKKDAEERWKRIAESRYNKWYRVVKGEGIPKYLKRIMKSERWCRICRFRMGEEMRECKYWMEEYKRKCRVCQYKREDWERVLERCNGRMDEERSVGERVIWILDKSGQGKRWMNGLECLREKRKEGLL